ncbi:MAG TPA: cohesin domain-containing protein, partial [Saprospiraceae bacterium]|nr:cohesin domain-containing protein [Saprospiraceae bacterium]
MSTTILVGAITVLQSQSCFELRFSTKNASAGDTVRIALTTRGFTELSSYQFAVEWNPADLQYIQRDLSNSPLDFQLFNAAYSGQGKLLTLWSDVSAMGITLPNDAVLFEIDFKVLATEPGLYPVKINPNGTPIYEAVQESAQSSNRLPFAHVWGGVRLGGSGNLAVSSLCAEQAPCNAPTGVVNTVIEGGTPPYQFLWTGPNGYTSDESSPAGLALGYYELIATDAIGISIQAAVELPFVPFSPIIIDTLSTKNAVCSQPNGCLALKAIGGTAPFLYQWETSGGETGSRCDLTPGYHKITVTDALGCYGAAQFIVGNDSLLSVELDSINADCRFGQLGSVNLSANGTAPYTYNWSNGATTQHLTGLQPGWYTVTVSDAAGCDAVGKVK